MLQQGLDIIDHIDKPGLLLSCKSLSPRVALQGSMDTKESKPLFTLSVAAEIIGVHPRTLMIYEKEGLISPERTKTNRRRFSKNDLRKLNFIRFLTNKRGINLAGVSAILYTIEKVQSSIPSIQKDIFPDFENKDLT